MNRKSELISILISVLGIATFVGCSQQSTTSSPPQSAPSTANSGGDAMPEGLAKLSETDRDAALKQVICPVSGEKLGSMGAPPKVTVEGKEVFLCCSGCEKDLREEPAKHLAKLKSE